MDFGPGRGTPLYMAPEVIDGGEPTVRSDIYSLGVLLYFLAAANYPVRGQSMDELRHGHAAREAAPLRDTRPDLPAALVHAIEQSLAADPAARYASAGAMERALAAAVTEAPAIEPPPGAAAAATPAVDASASARAAAPIPSATRASASRVRATIVVFCAALVLMVAAGSYFASRASQRAPGAGARADGARAGALAPASPLAASAFTVSASAYRGASQRERLANGARVAPGDSISIAITASESLFAYVINEDDRGEAYLLFPSDEYQPRNPLVPGVEHHLPGTRRGRVAYWEITTAGGREHLLLVASRERLVTFENAALGLARPTREGVSAPAPAPIDAQAMIELRGMGGFVEENGSASARALSKSLFEMAEPLRNESESVRGVWIRKLTLEIPPS